MTLRPAQISDAASLAALSIEVWLSTYVKHGITDRFASYVLERFTVQNMQSLLDDPKGQILVSQNTQGIDGYIRLCFDRPAPIDDGATTEISTLYVQPRHHGRGLGQQLLSGAYDLCRARRRDSVWLTTNAENTPAIGFYRRQGFKEVGTSYFELDGAAYPNTVFQKSLI